MGKSKKKVIDTEDHVELRRLCKYIGSFAINMMKSEERQSLMNERLEELKNVKKGINVLMSINTDGIKVYDEKEVNVKMAHAIMRVAFSTCSPDTKLFAYVARSSTSASLKTPSILQAHVFKTKKATHAQQMAALVSKAFRIAFAMATIDRNSKREGFENDVENAKEDDSPLGQRRRWAKKEIARGHDLSEHAERAKRLNPLAMVPGKADPIDYKMLPSRKVSQTDFDNRMMAQSSRTSNGVDRVCCEAISENVHINTQPESRDNSRNDPVVVEPQKSHDEPLEQKDENNQIEASGETQRTSPVPTTLADETSIAMQEFIEGRVATEAAKNLIEEKVEEESNVISHCSGDGDNVSEYSNESVYQDMNAYSQISADHYVEKEYYSSTVRKIETKEEEPRNQVIDDAHEEQPRNQVIDDKQEEQPRNQVIDDTQEEQPLYQNIPSFAPEKPSRTTLSISIPSNSENEAPLDNGLSPVDTENRTTTPYMFMPETPEKRPPIENKRMTVTDEDLMRDSHWYQPGLSREISEEILRGEKMGCFFIRDSTSHPGSFAMTIKIPKLFKESGIGNILIEQTPEGDYKIPRFRRSFTSLPMLVAYYASFQDELPVKLRLTNENPLFDVEDGDQVDGVKTTVDPDYQRFDSSEGIMNELTSE